MVLWTPPGNKRFYAFHLSPGGILPGDKCFSKSTKKVKFLFSKTLKFNTVISEKIAIIILDMNLMLGDTKQSFCVVRLLGMIIFCETKPFLAMLLALVYSFIRHLNSHSGCHVTCCRGHKFCTVLVDSLYLASRQRWHQTERVEVAKGKVIWRAFRSSVLC